MREPNERDEVYKKYIREVPNFPKPGIGFKDITPLLADGEIFTEVVDRIAGICEENALAADVIACPEARGFIFGAALACRLRIGFVPIRKPGKLPWKTCSVVYALEYGNDTVQMHTDAVRPGQRVLIVDDLLATGGTTAACAELVTKCGGSVAACVFLVELCFLEGRKRLGDLLTFSLIRY